MALHLNIQRIYFSGLPNTQALLLVEPASCLTNSYRISHFKAKIFLKTIWILGCSEGAHAQLLKSSKNQTTQALYHFLKIGYLAKSAKKKKKGVPTNT